jgi:integrase
MPTIRKRGKRYQVQVRIKELGVIVFQDSATFDNRKTAQLWGLTLEAKLGREGIQAQSSGGNTLASLVERWVTAKEKRAPMSSGTLHSANAIISSTFAGRPIAQVSTADITQWALTLPHLHPSTVLHHVMTLRAVYAAASSMFGVDADVRVVANATAQLMRLRAASRSTRRERRASDAELDAIAAHLEAHSGVVRTADYVRLAVALPRRREELTSVLWAQYNPQQGTITLLDTKSKGAVRNEVVPVPPLAQAILAHLPRTNERILPYKNESISAAFQRAVKALAIEDLRLHDLRHEGISRLFEMGLDIPEVSLISGHTDWASLRRYTQLKPANIVEKLRAYSQRTTPNPA